MIRTNIIECGDSIEKMHELPDESVDLVFADPPYWMRVEHDNVSDEEYAKGKRKQLGSVWRIAVCQGSGRLKDAEGKKLHSTQKPEELFYRVIAISSKAGDIVLDPFGGTFTTAAIAKRLGRSYISYDMDETYCEYGRKRIEQEKYVPNGISKAVFDEKPLRVKVEDMIRDGFLHAGENFYMKDRECQNISLLTNGKLMFNGTEIDMHSCAARVREVKADRLNGFDYWMVEREGKMVSISDVREEYRRFAKEKFARHQL